ncbi:protein kinase [Streptomyces sp. NPDC052023]|uniref:serine/threonine-protein kinase n=1 Tax=Streptomyces sp. NPDC052023 TaxID=3365681 RepID=UPI0037CFAA2D
MSDGGELQRDGRLVGGRYRLRERIGSGRTGTVWRARDERAGREVAVKEPRLPGGPEDGSHRRAAHRLYHEARAAARVGHRSAVTIHDVVEEDGIPWIVMELVRGESLHAALRRGPVPPAESARIGLAVLGALRAAHAVGIVHRDVRPANVLLGPHGRVVLTDFGVAHVPGGEPLAAGGEFAGSPEFVAPERMSGRTAGPASDLWSLGAVLYTAVEGRPPYRRTTPESTLAAILAADPPEPKQAGPLGPLLVRLLARDPERRPAPEEVAAGLRAVAEGRPEAPDGTVTAGQEGADPAESESGNVRLPGAPSSSPEPGAVVPGERVGLPGVASSSPEPGAVGTEEPDTSTGRARHPLRGPAPAVLLGALLAGGVWFATSSFRPVAGDASATERTATPSAAPGVTAPGAAWTAHREKDLAAVLFLPGGYEETAREGGAGDVPRLVVYDLDRTVQVRLTRWDKAPGSPMTRARAAHVTWDSYDGDARTRYTRTTFDGREAVLADTTYNRAEDPSRVMQLVIRSGGTRMYELRVDMPHGTPGEKEGTAVFRGARGRLLIETGPGSPTP